MIKTAEAAELARRLMEFLDDVKAGHEVLVTRNEQPVARLIPIPPAARNGRRSLLDLHPLSGRWIGETVVKSGDVADEMFARE